MKEDIFLVLSHPMELISINIYTFTWVRYEEGYEVYNSQIKKTLRPIKVNSIAEVLNVVLTSTAFMHITSLHQSLFQVRSPYKLDSDLHAILECISSLFPKTITDLLNILDSGTVITASLREITLDVLHGDFIVFMVGPYLYCYKQISRGGDLVIYFTPEDSLLVLACFVRANI